MVADLTYKERTKGKGESVVKRLNQKTRMTEALQGGRSSAAAGQIRTTWAKALQSQ